MQIPPLVSRSDAAPASANRLTPFTRQPGALATGDRVEWLRSRPPASPQAVLDIAALDRRISQETGTAVTTGNKMQVFVDGATAFPEMQRLIAGAQHTIHLETFIFHNDATSWQIARALAEQADKGVKVRVSTTIEGDPVTYAASGIFRFMQAHGIEVKHPKPETLSNPTGIDHRKVLIVDGASAMTGGMNIGDEYHHAGPKTFHDVMVRVEGPAVRDLQRHFLESWREAGGGMVKLDAAVYPPLATMPAGGSAVRVLTTHPGNDIQRALFAAIESARRNINIEAAYFTDDLLVDRLVAAAKRGVTVNIILPAVSDNAVVDAAARHHFARLTEAGANIHVYTQRWIHTKAASIDGQWAMVGSCNFDNRSYNLDWEMDVAFSDPASVAQLDQRLLARDLAQTPRLGQPNPSLWQRTTTKVVRLFNHLL